MKRSGIVIALTGIGIGAWLIQKPSSAPSNRVVVASKHLSPQLAKSGSSWRALFENYPDGSVALECSRDGRTVRVDPLDKRRPLQWNTTYLEVSTLRHLNIEPRRVQRMFAHTPFYLGFDANLNRAPLSICSTSTGACRPLHDQPQGLHRQVIDFDNQRFFCSSSQEITAVNEGEVLHYSTQTGALTSRVRFMKKNDSTNNPVVLSPDGRWLIAEVIGADVNSQNATSLFDARTGKVRFELSNEDQAADAGFSPSGREFYAVWPDTDWNRASIAFKSTSDGRTLWQARTSADSRPAFFKMKNWVAFSGPRGMEVRDVTTGKIKQSFEGPNDGCRLAFSPDGKTIWSSQRLNQNGFSAIWSWRVR